MTAPAPLPVDQRFAQLIRQFGLTKNSFAISLGKTASVVQHLIDGRNKPGFDLLCKVFEIYPNVSRDWLLLGRGPMLVSGGPAPKPPVARAFPAALAPESDLEPIDLADVAINARRRPANGAAGTRLQPEEIAATLALAAATNGTAHASPPTSDAVSSTEPLRETSKTYDEPIRPAASGAEAPPVAPEPRVASPVAPAAPLPATPPAPVSVAAAPAASLSPETYVAAALNAQHLQHQLALAELRNQHLLEQQQMLREMLAMARQAMV